jgi:lipopolysaccharide transport system permease protein
MMEQVRTLEARRPLMVSLRQLLAHRELLVILTQREIRARYRQSMLGFGWAIVQPVFQMIVISIIFGSFLRLPSEGVPYPVFAYVAILPWTLFSGSITAAVASILANMPLITKVHFPREILPLSAILARFVDFAIASIVFAGLLIWYDIPIHETVVYLPLLLTIQIVLAAGIGLLGAAISVFLRDVSFAMPMLMLLWMYGTPVIYSLDMVPQRWLGLYMLNPMAGLIDSYRKTILRGEPPNLEYLAISATISLLLFVLSYVYFKRLDMTMADII